MRRTGEWLCSVALHAAVIGVLFCAVRAAHQSPAPIVELDLSLMPFSSATRECPETKPRIVPDDAQPCPSLRTVRTETAQPPDLPRPSDIAAAAHPDEAIEPMEPLGIAAQEAPNQAHVQAPPSPVCAIRPNYPRQSRKRGEEGRVVVQAVVDAEGSVQDVRIVEACGHAELDQSALAAVREARFRPAQCDGVPVTAIVCLPIVFTLR